MPDRKLYAVVRQNYVPYKSPADDAYFVARMMAPYEGKQVPSALCVFACVRAHGCVRAYTLEQFCRN